MKKITLKLTDAEKQLLNPEGDSDNVILGKIDAGYTNYLNGETGHFLLVRDVDKFRDVLNNEIDKCFPTTIRNGLECSEMLCYPNGSFYEGSESQKRDNLKSILSKLEKALLFKYHNNPMDNYELEDDGLTIDDIK